MAPAFLYMCGDVIARKERSYVVKKQIRRCSTGMVAFNMIICFGRVYDSLIGACFMSAGGRFHLKGLSK